MKNLILLCLFSFFMLTVIGCDKITEEETMEKIEILEQKQVLVLTKKEQLVINEFVVVEPPAAFTWPCIGNGLSFVRCTQRIIDNSGCGVVVPHPNNPGEYCSRPCN